MKLKSTDYLLTMGQRKEIHLDTFIAEQDVVKSLKQRQLETGVCVCVLQLPSILECLYLTHEIDTKLLHTVTH